MLDLSGVTASTKVGYLRRLRPTAEAHREQHGFPHWVIYDEAHLLGTDEQASWARRGGYVLSSFAPALLPAHEIDSSDVVLTLSNADAAGDVASLRRASARFGFGPSRGLTIAERRTAHVGHRHKYADMCLPKEPRFYFHTTEGQAIAPAASMHDFGTAIRHVDEQALQYHLERGDFSGWLDGTIADTDLATQVAAWEDRLLAHRAADLKRIRHQLIQAVAERYLDVHDDH